MKTEQIIYLDDISRTHSITQTAQRFFISQQALSFSLKKLEEEFETQFLIRSNHGAELTRAGDLFLRKARSIIDTYSDLKKDMQLESVSSFELDQEPEGQLKIVSHTRVLESLLADILEKYIRKYPHVQIILNEKENIDIIDEISNDMEDIGILFAPEILLTENKNTTYKIPENVKIDTIFSDEFIVCCNRNHPLSQSKDLSLSEFPDIPVVCYDTNPLTRPLGQPFSLNDNQNLQSSIFFSNNSLFHTSMAEKGLAVSVITGFEFRKLYLKNKDLTAVPLKDNLKSTISIVTNSKKELSFASILFIKLLQTYDFYGM